MPSKEAHAARIENGIVQEVIVIPYCNDDDSEITAYCNDIGLPGVWIDCSLLGARRKKYPGVGWLYDADLDEFLIPENNCMTE
jgi:hypothetical protein